MKSTSKDMKIAPKKCGGYWTAEDWRRLNLGSGNDPGNEERWKTAIQIFEDRIRGRFTDAIEILKHADSKSNPRRFGFAIMSLICLLIETLAQFYEGIPSSRGVSRKIYIDFLSQRSFVLKKFFDVNYAQKFYDTVRSGLLHHAETDRSSLIRYKNPSNHDSPFEPNGDGLIVYWSAFYDLLKQEFDAYISNLKNRNYNDVTLRKNFIKKMNYICRLENEA